MASRVKTQSLTVRHVQDMWNWTGFCTLFKKEFLRFFKVPNNTIFPQLVTVLFYFLIFGLAIGALIKEVAGVPYLLFILPGLFVQNIINGSYSNPSGSLFIGKVWGSLTDVLLAPLSHAQFILAYIFAGMCRGLFLGLGTILLGFFFTPIVIEHVWIFLTYVILISFFFACCGFIVGLWSKNWDQLNIFINFVVTPLTFLGGVFYTLDMVPPVMQFITKLNPVFYMINGVRYGMIGVSDGNVYLGMIFLVLLFTLVFGIVHLLVKKGYNLRV